MNRTLVGEVQALCTPTVLDQQNFWSWHAASNCGRALTMRLLFPLSYTSGAGAAIRTPITDLRGRALPTELHQHKTSSRTLEAVGRIALPMISFAGRCLAVLATPPHKSGAEGGTRTRALDVGNVASWPLDDFRPHKILERAARVELASSGWRPEAPAAIPCPPFTTGRGDRIRTCLNSFWRRAPFPSGHHPCGGRNGS